MKICIIGHKGMLGQDMMIEAQKENHEVIGVDIDEINITDKDSVETVLNSIKPDAVINCAAYTAVDLCEEKVDLAFSVNGDGPENIGLVANELDIPVVHISTDYVFNGKNKDPYTELSATSPESVYGKSKLSGEEKLIAATDKHYILRIAWLYGEHGNNFAKTISGLARDRDSLKVVNDQYGTPTWTVDVCRQIFKILKDGKYGIYHSTSEGSCSWFDFTKYIIDAYNISCEILPCTTEEFPRPAPRPAYSVLENCFAKEQGINVMPHWKEAFDNYVKSEGL